MLQFALKKIPIFCRIRLLLNGKDGSRGETKLPKRGFLVLPEVLVLCDSSRCADFHRKKSLFLLDSPGDSGV
jgi:hypothetical protein